MAIVELVKVTLVGQSARKDVALSGLQSLGEMHLIPLNPVDKSTVASELPAKTVEAVRYLEQTKHRLKPRKGEKATASADVPAIVDEVLQQRKNSREVKDRIDELHAFIKIREEWGDFEFPPVSAMGGIRFWFYEVTRSKLETIENSGYPFEILKEKHGVFYIIVLSESEPSRKKIPIKRVRAGVKSLQTLKQYLYDAELQLEELQLQKTSLTRWLAVLKGSITASLEKADYCLASQGVSVEKALFYVSGWLPADKLDVLSVLCEEYCLVMVQEAIKDDESPPTLLSSKPWYEGAQKVIEFFQMPGYRDWDPSVMVFFSFCLFYSMILSDAGYACLMLAGLAFSRKRFKRTRSGVAFFRMGLSMSGCALVWGVFVGSYFGAAPTQDSLLDSLAFLDLNDFETMIRLSVGIGVFHLILANGSAAYYQFSGHSGRKLQALSYVGWITVFLAGYGWWMVSMNVFSNDLIISMAQPVVSILMLLGAVLVFVFSSDRKVSTLTSLLLRIIDGFKGLMGFSKGFGDALSYMRLFALGLSSAQLAITFNKIAFDMLEAMPGVGVFFCVLILLFGHALNLVLGVMGGVIHGLRLNLIEFYHWGIHDEGYLFKPFSKREDESWKH